MARAERRARARLVAGAAATAAVLGFPAMASAAVTSSVVGTELRVTSDAADAVTITCEADQVKVNGGDPGSGAYPCATLTSIVVTGGPGANAITLTGVTAAAFPAITGVMVDGGAGADTIAGSEHADALYGGSENDRILGDDNAPGTRDAFYGQAGDDTLVWNPGDDDDTMEGGDGADTIEVNGGGGPELFAVAPSATAGRVQFDRTGPTPPGPFNLDIGTAERLDLNAGGGDDSMASADGMLALAFALDIDGGEGNDTLDGADGADLIAGGAGNDRIIGDDNPAGTRDTSVGQAGDDTMVWNPGDDDDVNEGGEGSDTVEVNGGGPEAFEVKPSATAGRIAFDRTSPAPFNVDIGTSERLDFNAGAGDDSMASSDGMLALAFALDIDGGEGNDTLDGADGADLIAGGAGNDRIIGDDNPAGTRDTSVGDAGDDTMVWNPGDDDDVNEGGEGSDTVEVNGGDAAETFEVKPSAVAGRVAFDRTTPAPFSVDIGTSEQLLLNAAGGDDRILGADGLAALIRSTLNGQDGNDRLRGTDGPDLLSGGNGTDLIKARDGSEDRVECDAGIDFARVDSQDLVRGCELVLGGLLRVRTVDRSVDVAGGAAALRLRCVATQGCRGVVRLRRGGKAIGGARFAMGRRDARTVRVRLNRRGRRLVANAPGKGLRVQARIDARDARGNGWRSVTRLRLSR